MSKQIIVEYDDFEGQYIVRFIDDNGESILAKTPLYKRAMTFQKKFRKNLKDGRLLKEDKSVWN